MRKTYFLLAASMTLSTLAFAENWSGRLLDAGCYFKQQSSIGCDAVSTTTAFALDAGGKVFKLDEAGNRKAADAIKNRADRIADPSNPVASEVTAKVQGMETGGTIAVEIVEVP
jgi:hypothetical protein